MCGATNVTLDERDIKAILVPIPSIKTQQEIVRGILAREAAIRLRSIADEINFGISESSGIVSDLNGQISRLLRISKSSPKLELA
jgi:type I restriction enzyme M protein